MKNYLSSLVPRAACAALFALVSTFVSEAQSTGTVYWNTDNDDGSIVLEAPGATSSDQAGNIPSSYDPNTDDPDFIFSSDKVGTEAQTVGLDNGFYEFSTLSFLKGSIDMAGPVQVYIDSTLTVGPNAGPTTINLSAQGSSAAGSLNYLTNTWNNNSSSDLTIDSDVLAVDGTDVLTLDGTGTGAIRILGNFSGAVDQESATSTLYLEGTAGSTSAVTIDKGTIIATNVGSLGGASISLENGGTLGFSSSLTFNQAVTTSGGGVLDFVGDSLLNWGNGNSNTVTGDSLTFSTGDDLDTSRTSLAVSTLNLVGNGTSLDNGHRIILGIQGQGLGLISGVSTINVSNDYIMDFGSSGTYSGVLNFLSSSALEARNNVTVTLTNALLPTSGTWNVGNDDVGSNDTFYFPAAQTVNGPLTINMLGGGVSTHLQGAIGGTGGLTFAAPGDNGNGAGLVYLDGTNTYSGPTILAAGSGSNPNYPVVAIGGNSTGIGNEIDVQAGVLVLETGSQLSPTSIISLGNPSSSQNSDNLSLQIGLNGGASATVYNVAAVSPWNNPNDRSGDHIDGSGSTLSTLTWDVASGTETFQGRVGQNNNELALVKTGAGTLTFTSNNNTYIGGTTIDQGVFSVFGGGNFGAGQAGAGTGAVTINNAATLNVIDTYGFSNQVILGTKGTLTVNGGDTYQVAAQLSALNQSGGGTDSIFGDPNGAIGNGQAGIVGGNGVAIVGGDLLIAESEVTTPGEVDIVGGRLLMFNNDDFIAGATSVTTAGGILDFGSQTSVVSAPVYVGANGTINDRHSNVTINTLTPIVGASGNLPTLLIGPDDDSNNNGSFTVTNAVALSSNFTISSVERNQLFNGNGYNQSQQYADVNFAGGFSGTGNLTFNSPLSVVATDNLGITHVGGTSTYKGDTSISSGILDLTGNNTAVTSASGGAPNYYITASTQSYVDYNGNAHSVYTPGILQIGKNGTLASNANVVVGGSAGFAYLVLGDGTGAANTSVGSITLSDSSSGINGGDNGAILGGSTAISTLGVNVAAGSTDIYNGLFGYSYGYDFNHTLADYASNSTASDINDDQQNLAVVFNIGAGGTMMLGGFSNDGNPITGGFTVNGGTLEIYKQADALGTANVTLNNATLAISNGQYASNITQPHIILGTGTNTLNSLQGIDSYHGDVQTGVGSTGELHVNGSNFILTGDGTNSSIKTLDIDSGRIFLFGSNGLGFLANNTTVNVNNNAFLDLATGTTATLNNQINFSSGTGLVQRNSGTNITLTNANLPTAGTFTIGSDDVGGDSNVSFKITSNLALTGNLQLNVIGNSNVPVTLAGNISGNGGITESNGGQNGGNLFLTGTNTYSGTTSALFANLYIDGNNSGAGVNYFSNFSTITIGNGGQIASNAHLQFGNGNGPGTFVLGDGNGAVSQTVAALDQLGNGAATVYNGNTLNNTNSVLTVSNTSGNNTFSGVLGNSSTTNGNNLALVKAGTSTLTLSGANTYTGGTTVNGGKLAIDGSIAGNAVVNVGAEIGGHGFIAGALSGAGAVGPGDSPGILTASSVDPSAGTSFNFEFTLAMPNFASATNSGNDVLHLEGATPFTVALTAANALNLYFASAGSFEGGFFTDGLTDNLTSNVANATYNYYVLDNTNGIYSYNGNHYDLTTGLESTVPAAAAAFADGTKDGYTQEFVVAPAVATPEPSTYALIGAALLVLVVFRRRRSA